MTSFVGFSAGGAQTYDERVRKHIPGYELLHSLSEVMLAGELPEKAAILAVGTGTGYEILGWAPKHPGWMFLGTDTAPAMLEVTKQRVQEMGFSARVRLHDGTVESAPSEKFDAATLLLVLHFVPDDQKGALFSAIAERLKPGAPFVMATLFGDIESTRFKRLSAARKTLAIARGLDPQMAEQFCDPHREDMHIVPEERIKALLRDAGFIDVQRVFQALTVGLWFARTNR